MAWVKMKDSLGNMLTIPKQMYNDMFKHNPAYSIAVEQPKTIKKEVPVMQKTKKMEGKDNGTISDNERIDREC